MGLLEFAMETTGSAQIDNAVCVEVGDWRGGPA